MITYEGVRLRVLKYWRVGWAKIRKKQLKITDFTILSNNCWGGMIYESYDLPKSSPTIGMFFMAEDYIQFLSDLKGYIHGELKFIKPKESKWKTMPELARDKRYGSYPVGVLSNGKKTIELFFLHYHSEQEAREKWERRIRRIHWNKLLVKFNDQNGCTEADINQFMQLPYKNKLFFTCKKWDNVQGDYTVIHQFPKHPFIMASYEPFGKKITAIINQLQDESYC